MKTQTTTAQLIRRGHRLKRLAYELGGLAADARYHGMGDTVANGLNEAADQARFAGERYLACQTKGGGE